MRDVRYLMTPDLDPVGIDLRTTRADWTGMCVNGAGWGLLSGFSHGIEEAAKRDPLAKKRTLDRFCRLPWDQGYDAFAWCSVEPTSLGYMVPPRTRSLDETARIAHEAFLWFCVRLRAWMDGEPFAPHGYNDFPQVLGGYRTIAFSDWGMRINLDRPQEWQFLKARPDVYERRYPQIPPRQGSWLYVCAVHFDPSANAGRTSVHWPALASPSKT